MRETDYYRILNLTRETTDEEIKRTYRRLALEYHPDRNPTDKEAEEKFKEINEAYSVLGDPKTRREYDNYGHTRFRGRYASDDIANFGQGYGRMRMNGFFGRGMGCRRRARFWKCHSSYVETENPFSVDGNIVYQLTISAEESHYGTERNLIARTPWGQRSYRLTIPAGTPDGARVNLSLKEDDYNSNDICIQIHVTE